MKILNLYAGIGGNRKLWGDEHEVTAVEKDFKIAGVYRELFPKDQVIVDDAHQYLLDHYQEFDLIWSSPPCPTHSVCNNFLHAQGCIRYPAMELWQEIIFLKHFCEKKGILWVVENVRSYYEPMIKPQEAGRHFFWSNFKIPGMKIECKFNTTNMRDTTRKSSEEHLKLLQEFYGIDLSDFEINLTLKKKVLSNCVYPKLGLHVFNAALNKSKGQLKL